MRYVIREKFFHLGEDSQITDEQGRVIYEVDGKILSLHNTLTVRDASGQEVATVKRQLIALTPTYTIERPGVDPTIVRKRFINLLGDRFTIDIPGPHDLEMDGALFEHDYRITRDGAVVATVSKRWIAMTDTYGVETAPGEDDILILASVLALDLAEDREDRE
ncbi:MAG: LURP-one-related/scramblase family protein [Ktedonobacterales bacterium]